MSGPGSTSRDLEARLGYKFRDRSLLAEALTHASAQESHNERLEFLGDAVLNLVVSDHLYHQFAQDREGRLTELKAFLVARKTLEEVAERLQLGTELQIGGGLEKRGSVPRSLLGNALEAVLGAIYLDDDGQLNSCRRVVNHWLTVEWSTVEGRQFRRAAKQELQTLAQQQFGALPTYTVLQSFEHPETFAFQVRARVGKRHFPSAWATTKKEAERLAAWEALLELRADHAD
ncbi:MAG: ribonuclease III [Planctomycetes bacterium]|nr:ribonuclease III [Planctomycetota bacterium]